MHFVFFSYDKDIEYISYILIVVLDINNNEEHVSDLYQYHKHIHKTQKMYKDYIYHDNIHNDFRILKYIVNM